MTPRIIIHADDLGASPEVSRHIETAVTKGHVTNVSAMANGMDFAPSMARMKKVKAGIALHLNLTIGRPISNSPDVQKYLCTKDGEFKYSFFGLCLLQFHPDVERRNKSFEAILSEIRAQIDLYKNHLPPSSGGINIDGHQHIQAVPTVVDALRKLSDQYNFKHIRVPKERIAIGAIQFARPFGYINVLKCLVLNYLSKPLKRFLERKNISHNDYIIGILNSGQMSFSGIKASLRKIENCNEGVEVQILLHPGYAPSSELSEWQTKAQYKFFKDAKRTDEYLMAFKGDDWASIMKNGDK
jgi:predicted glycoside hydrolase/deacetylase ChbG (UPF0249 family)